MENYIMINGKRIDLTPEQIETLVGKKEKDPFERDNEFFYIDYYGEVERERDDDTSLDVARYIVANYCTDRELMEQRALHETLNRLLWRYSMQHGGREFTCEGSEPRYFIIQNSTGKWCIDAWFSSYAIGVVYFDNKLTANAAIEEIVKPFMEKHPEFRW